MGNIRLLTYRKSSLILSSSPSRTSPYITDCHQPKIILTRESNTSPRRPPRLAASTIAAGAASSNSWRIAKINSSMAIKMIQGLEQDTKYVEGLDAQNALAQRSRNLKRLLELQAKAGRETWHRHCHPEQPFQSSADDVPRSRWIEAAPSSELPGISDNMSPEGSRSNKKGGGHCKRRKLSQPSIATANEGERAQPYYSASHAYPTSPHPPPYVSHSRGYYPPPPPHHPHHRAAPHRAYYPRQQPHGYHHHVILSPLPAQPRSNREKPATPYHYVRRPYNHQCSHPNVVAHGSYHVVDAPAPDANPSSRAAVGIPPRAVSNPAGPKRKAAEERTREDAYHAPLSDSANGSRGAKVPSERSKMLAWPLPSAREQDC